METTIQLIREKFGEESIVSVHEDVLQPFVVVKTDLLFEICQEIYSNTATFYDYLSCLTAVDNGEKAGTLEVIYHLFSIPFEQKFIIKVFLPREIVEGKLPEVASVSSIWKTANWHEREAYDLIGINFLNHPDLRRILLPADWEGHPLRKDYDEQEYYHGIQVKY
ncbi:MAG: NADH-quinone oxidoreductase subunit C [Cytophagales bacterium]|nr:NADH-quinone oxidoreductase subunit C [Cytophagales bacterium]